MYSAFRNFSEKGLSIRKEGTGFGPLRFESIAVDGQERHKVSE